MLADIAGEAHPPAIRRDVDVLGDIGAVEDERIDTGLTLDDVAAVTRVPDEGVVAGAEKRRIVAGSSNDEIAALAADQEIVPRPPFRVKAILPAARLEALIVSLPARPFTVSWSVASAPAMVTAAGKPLTEMPPPTGADG